jgi:hypothetical protein
MNRARWWPTLEIIINQREKPLQQIGAAMHISNRIDAQTFSQLRHIVFPIWTFRQ